MIIIITTGHNSTAVPLIQNKCHTTADYTAVLKAEYSCGKCTKNRWSFDIDCELNCKCSVEVEICFLIL